MLGSRSGQSIRRPGTAGTGGLGPNWVMYEADESRDMSAEGGSDWQDHSGGSGSGGGNDVKEDASLSKPSVGEGPEVQHGSGQSEQSKQSEASSHVRAFV